MEAEESSSATETCAPPTSSTGPGASEQPRGVSSGHNEGDAPSDTSQQGQPAAVSVPQQPATTAGSSMGLSDPAGSSEDAGADAPAAAQQQIGQLQAELAAVRQSLATYESTLQMLVSELGTQSQLPAALQQLQQQRPQNPGNLQQQQLPGVPALQHQHRGQTLAGGCDTSSSLQHQPAGGAVPAHAPLSTGASSGGAGSAEAGVAAAEGSTAPQHVPTSAAEVGEPPAQALAAGSLQEEQHRVPPGRQPSLQQWGWQRDDHASSQEFAVSIDDPAVLMWRQQHQQHQWQQVPSAPLYGVEAPSGFSGLYQQPPMQAVPHHRHQQLSMQHSAPQSFAGQQRGAQGVPATVSAQLGSSFGSGLGPFGTSFGGAEDPASLGAAGRAGSSSGQAPGASLSLSPRRQQQQVPSPQAADSASAGAALSDSGASFDFLRQGLTGLVSRRSVPADPQQGPSTTSVGSLQPGLAPAGLHRSLDAGLFGSSGPKSGGTGSADSPAGGAGGGFEAGIRPGSAAGMTASPSAAAGSVGSLSQSQNLSSSIGPAGALAGGSGLTLPVLTQGAQLMGLLPPLPGSSAGAGARHGGMGQLAGTLTPSPGGSIEGGPSSLLMHASSSALASVPMQQALPPPGIIHHLLTDTAGSLDLMSSLSPGAGASGFGGAGSSAAAAVAAAAAAAAAANYTGSFGSEHSIGSFGMLSGALSGSAALGQSHGAASGYEHDAVPGSRGIDQYTTQQLAVLQGLLQQQSSASSQDPAAASGSMDPLVVLQQLQAHAMLAAASGQHPSQELVGGMPGFAGSAEQQQQMLAAALSQLGIKDPASAAVAAAAAAAAANRAGGVGVPLGVDPAAALAAAAAAAAAGGDPSQAQQFAQMQAALASLNLQAQAHVEYQALQQAQLVQQLQQHHSAHQLLVVQAAAAAAAATALRQQGSSSSWHGDRRLSNAVAAGKLLGGHGSGGSTGSSGGRRSSRGGDALGSSARDARKASSTGERTSRTGAAPDWRRVFVGNIGWWVDEEMLHRVFGEYGTILDAQVMWNTKLLAKGKRVNREFAFISYNSPDEAGNAIRNMHGRYIEGLAKDRDGLTVQYEAQGVGKPTGLQPPPSAQQAFAPPAATQQHFLLHQIQQQQQMLLQQGQQAEQAGLTQHIGELQQPGEQQLGAGPSRFAGAGPSDTSAELQQN